MTYIAVDSDIDLFIHIIDTHNGMSHAKIVKIRNVHRADGTLRMCSRCRRVKTVVWGQRNTRVDPTHATWIDRFPLCMTAFVNYVPHRKLSSTETMFMVIVMLREIADRLCGLVVRVSGNRYRGLGFDSRRCQIFWVVVGLERGPISLVRSIEELLE